MPTIDSMPDDNQHLSPLALQRFPSTVLKMIIDYLSASDRPDLLQLMYCSKDTYRRFYPFIYEIFTLRQQHVHHILSSANRVEECLVEDDKTKSIDNQNPSSAIPSQIEMLGSTKHLILEDLDSALSIARFSCPTGNRPADLLPIDQAVSPFERVETLSFGFRVIQTLDMESSSLTAVELQDQLLAFTSFLRPRHICFDLLKGGNDDVDDVWAVSSFFNKLHEGAKDSWTIESTTMHGVDRRSSPAMLHWGKYTRIIFEDCPAGLRKKENSAELHHIEDCICLPNFYWTIATLCSACPPPDIAEILQLYHLELINLPCSSAAYFKLENIVKVLIGPGIDFYDESTIGHWNQALDWMKTNLTVTSKEDAEPCACCGKL
ncbi:hypothetical protein V865_005472 [Kwoniella europaea PYCC6329]|uniref:F-box domain-containing protein n=1 Tax=Kwoniella europaea PYCC6329 TaxID=1423913 RepID=A0AAX4KN17_9TREE